MSCYTCEFFVPLDEKENLTRSFGHWGACHGHAPNAMMFGVVNQSLGAESKFSVWPFVKADDFCGDYSPNEAERERRRLELENSLHEGVPGFKILHWIYCKLTGQ